jgi:predicted TIM-barrel fold metal-dependent hydrolase
MKDSASEKIDIFSHILPLKYKNALYKKARRSYYLDVSNGIPALFDLESRFRVMDKFEGLREVLTLAVPPLEHAVDRKDAMELARLANDEMAELLVRYPDRFVAAAACLPMNDIDAALLETDRAIRDLNFRGIQIFSSIDNKPLDCPEFTSIYEKLAKYDLPIWIHPTHDGSMPDYPGETESRYLLFVIFGWPYQTSLAMARLVFSGIMAKFPKIKIITHHCGGMIPSYANRLSAPSRLGNAVDLEKMSKPPIEYFRDFFADTVLNGNTAGLMCGYSFFGADHMVFASDYPYPGGPQKGELFLKQTIESVERMDISQEEKDKVFYKNAKRIMLLPG